MLRWLSSFWWIPLNTVGPCVGLSLFRWFRWKVELWYAPADYAPPEHTHEHSDGEFTILYSKNRRIWRKVFEARNGVIKQHEDSYVATTPDVWGKWLSVRAGTTHAFATGDSCMIWLCVEHWKPGVKVTSVATDFVMT